MPNLGDHISKAKHNEQFFSSFDLDKTPYLDWVVNGVFYSTLHYLDSYFAAQNEHPSNYFERAGLIRQDANLGRRFYTLWYKPLKDDSENGRYDMRVFTADEIRSDIIPLLNQIKGHLKQYVTEIT